LRTSGTLRRFPERIELVTASPKASDAPALASRLHSEEVDDQALRVDLLCRLLAALDPTADSRCLGARGPELGCRIVAVRVRPGPPEIFDSDLAWLSAARCQAGMTALRISATFALTRWGWIHVDSGVGRTWVRLRR
jgi:hypothetical protein